MAWSPRWEAAARRPQHLLLLVPFWTVEDPFRGSKRDSPIHSFLLVFFPFFRLDHPLLLFLSRSKEGALLPASACGCCDGRCCIFLLAPPLSLSLLLLLLYSVAFLRQHEAPLTTRGNLLFFFFFFFVFLNTRNGEFPWARPEGKFLNEPSGSKLLSPF